MQFDFPHSLSLTLSYTQKKKKIKKSFFKNHSIASYDKYSEKKVYFDNPPIPSIF